MTARGCAAAVGWQRTSLSRFGWASRHPRPLREKNRRGCRRRSFSLILQQQPNHTAAVPRMSRMWPSPTQAGPHPVRLHRGVCHPRNLNNFRDLYPHNNRAYPRPSSGSTASHGPAGLHGPRWPGA
jgi:hypothetical protein